MRQFKKKLRLALKAENYFWQHCSKSAKAGKDSAREFRIETSYEINKHKRNHSSIRMKTKLR